MANHDPHHAGTFVRHPLAQLREVLVHVAPSGLEEIRHIEAFSERLEPGVPGGVVGDREQKLLIPNTFLSKSGRAGGGMKQRIRPSGFDKRPQSLDRSVFHGIVKVTGRRPANPVLLRQSELLGPERHQLRDTRRVGYSSGPASRPVGQCAPSSGSFQEWM